MTRLGIPKTALSPLVWLVMCVAAIAGLTALGPAEKTLGTNARVVYLHGVWVWASLAAFVAAAGAGISGLLTRSERWHLWSRALGRTGLVFWFSYLPISVWAMEANWNGLFLAEPRWRLAVIFAIGGLILQIGITLMDHPAWASVANILYVVALMVALQATENVMHPPAPILNSRAPRIQLYFIGLFLLTLLAAWQIARWWFQSERKPQVLLTSRRSPP